MHDKSISGIAGGSGLTARIHELRALGVRALQRMYLPSERLFAFRLRQAGGQDVLEGVSQRYSAIVLIALAKEPPEIAERVLAGHTIAEVCERLAADAESTRDLGEVALTAWACRVHGHPGAVRAIRRLEKMRPDAGSYPTVDVAWSLSALAVPDCGLVPGDLGHYIADRLKASCHPESGLFPHWPAGACQSPIRGHVACFADLVYPIQALSFYYRATGDPAAKETVRRCAARTCELQGPAGQWWWHYDVRTGAVVEKYPVYAIHQDAMGPMALLDALECCGFDHLDSVQRSMSWLDHSPEIDGSLVDRQAGVIWRKVARHEPGKLVRHLQAGLSRLHAGMRLPGVDLLFPTGYIDYETRPYHMGWMLYAWNPRRLHMLMPQRGAA